MPVAMRIALSACLVSHLAKAAHLRASTHPDAESKAVGASMHGAQVSELATTKVLSAVQNTHSLAHRAFVHRVGGADDDDEDQDDEDDYEEDDDGKDEDEDGEYAKDHFAANATVNRKPQPKALFCYALVRTPCSEICEMLATQLNAGCDGWALFGDTEDQAKHVTKVYSKAVVKNALKHQMREMITLGVWKHLDEVGALDEYEWFLKVDEDSFVRPSTLRKQFRAIYTRSRYDKLTTGDSFYDDGHFSGHEGAIVSDAFRDEQSVEGYFIALRADVVHAIKAMGWPRLCDELLSGHNDSPDRLHENWLNPCLESLGVGNIRALKDARGLPVVVNDVTMTHASKHFVSAHGEPFLNASIYREWVKRFP